MLGNNYWIEHGVPVLAHVDAAEEFNANSFEILQAMLRYNAERAEGTVPMGPTLTFEDTYTLYLGGTHIEVRHFGPAHTAGDVSVWLPDQGVLIAGDIAFNERMLPLFADTCTSCWIETWETVLEPLGATYVIPGHGHPTTMGIVRRYTHDYLVHLRAQIAAHIDNGGTLLDAYYVDQEVYRSLDTFDELATRNAGQAFEEMEWE
jgi:glyoxylase-like metal-dependent hydrolase (beta-lactamase superfamily II)